ncbi:MAG: hypothetical protein IH793_11270 [Acidobacteria bacterium]|nr:hypothetical protein [Acidobacteriota bacterium]
MGQFDDVAFTAEPGGTRRRVDGRQKHPVAGACLPQAGHGARREIHISKMTHYARRQTIALISHPSKE